MAGLGQHFIPKLFIRGFTNEHDSVWIYRVGEPTPIPNKRKKAARQRKFSSEKVDEIITDYEGRLAGLVNQLRNAAPEDPLDADVAAEVVSHLNIRTQHTRGTMSEMASGMFALIRDIAGSEEAMIRLLELDQPVASERAQQIVTDTVERIPMWDQIPELHGTFMRVGYFALREMFPGLYRRFRSTLAYALDDVTAGSNDLIRETHDRSLGQSLYSDGWFQRLKGLHWRIQITDEPVMLPDCVALAKDAQGNWVPLLSKGTATTAVVLPLTPTKLLIGSEGAISIDDEHFNACAAAACHQFFLVQETSDEFAALHKTIGQSTHATIADLMAEFRAQYMPPDETKGETTNSPKNEIETEQISFKLHFRDFADQQTAEQIVDSLRPLVASIARAWPFDLLEGVTFAIEYDEAIAEVPRGYETTQPEEPKSVQSAAVPILVKFDGVPQYRLVIRAWVAMALIGDDEATYRQALAVLVGEFLFVAMASSRERAYPRIGRQIDAKNVGEFLLGAVEFLPISYASSELVAELVPEFAEDQVSRAVAAVTEMHAELPEARWRYRHHGDVDELLRTSYRLVGNCLSQIAMALPYEAFSSNDGVLEPLVQDLQEIGLGDWLLLFRKDLESATAALPDWGDEAHFYLFTQHFERVLLNYGILVEQREDGLFHIHVPHGTDEQRMLDWLSEHGPKS